MVTWAPVSPWRIGVDVGGTFTDVVVIDATGSIGRVSRPIHSDFHWAPC